MDLGFMKPYKQFKYFLVVIDVFSWHIYAKPLASKTAPVVLKNLISILDSIDSPITSLVSDLGGEFTSKINTSYFKSKNILFRAKKYQKNKAAIAEHAVHLIKVKIYKMMRYYRTTNWVTLLPEAVKLLNSQPMDRNGGIAPQEINSFLDDVKLREARLKNHVNFPEPNRKEEKREDESNQNSNSDFKIGAYVYLEREAKLFQKSFELKVSLTQTAVVSFFEVKSTVFSTK